METMVNDTAPCILPIVDDSLSTPTQSEESRLLLRNFVFMSVCFSANHGAVLSVIDLSANFGDKLGSYSIGTLYGCYVISSTLFATSLISATSSKRVLVFSMALLAIYCCSYLVAFFFPRTAQTAVLFGAAIGGIGAGLQWTAQGAYFKLSSVRYARSSGVSEEEANGLLSSVFASIYLGLEMALKLSGSLIARFGSLNGKYGLYAVYGITAFAATFLMASVRNLKPDEDQQLAGFAEVK